MAGSEVTTLGQEITLPVNVMFQRRLLNRAERLCVYYAGVTPATIQRNGGSNVAKWRRYNSITPNLTARAEVGASNADVTFPVRSTSVRPSITEKTATVAKYGQFMYYTEELELYNYSNTLAELADVFGEAAGRTLNMLQRNEEEDNSSAYYASAVANLAAVNASISRNDIKYVVNWLNRNSAMKYESQTTGSQNFNTAPIQDAYLGLCHSDVEEDIRLLDGFISVERYAGQTSTYMGEFGSIGKVRFISSEDATIDLNSGAAVGSSGLVNTGTKIDTYPTVIYGKGAFGSVGLGTEHLKEIYKEGDTLPGVIIRRTEIGSAGAADPLGDIGTIGYKTFHAAAVLSRLDASNVTLQCRVIVSGATKLNT